MDHGAESYRKFLSGNDDGIVEIIQPILDAMWADFVQDEPGSAG